MAKSLRKVGLQIAVPVLVVLIAVNAYVVRENVKRIQVATGRRIEAALMQAEICNVLLDLDDMETGQRGYLLTGNAPYLSPYNLAKGRLPAHLSTLRSRFTSVSSDHERALLTKLESVAQAKLAEMEDTIRLREQGYRRRAFVLVDSNRGQQLMNEARAILNELSSAQIRNLARRDKELNETVGRAYNQSALATCVLLFVTAGTLLASNMHAKRLERQSAECAEQLRAASIQLERLTSMVFQEFRALVRQTHSHVNTLLDNYGGFLPRHGHEQAECIQNGTDQMNRLLDDLVDVAPPKVQ